MNLTGSGSPARTARVSLHVTVVQLQRNFMQCTSVLQYYVPAPVAGALSDDARLTSVAYIGPKSRTERTEIGTEVAHVTRYADTTFKVKRSKVNLQGMGHIVAASRTACFGIKTSSCLVYNNQQTFSWSITLMVVSVGYG